MAQATSPSMPLPDGNANNNAQSNKSDPEVPIDPSIAAATSPTYPPHGQYSPYPPQHEMPHYGGHPATPVYRTDQWGQHYPGMYGHAPVSSGPPAPSMVSPVQRPPTVSYASQPGVAYVGVRTDAYMSQGGHPLSTVYSFVPIPGAQQHKRPRRRYEEIERMYKCGWNGCEKAYGTLNHLNAHVTMQSHGQKRTPEGMWCCFPTLVAMVRVAYDRPQVYARGAFGVANYFGGSRSVGVVDLVAGS